MIGLVSFNDSAYAYNDTLTKATTANQELIVSYIDKIIASGLAKSNFKILLITKLDKFHLSSLKNILNFRENSKK